MSNNYCPINFTNNQSIILGRLRADTAPKPYRKIKTKIQNLQILMKDFSTNYITIYLTNDY